MGRPGAALALQLVLLLQPARTLAATWTVDAGGGGNFVTIQSAIEAVAPGDTILVHPGTYIEELHFAPDRDGTVLMGDGLREQIVIDGGPNVAVLIGDTDPAVHIERVTVTSGGTYGAFWVQSARVQIVDCVIRANNGPGECHGVGGGGRIMLGSDALVEGCLIEDNHDWESPGGLIVWQSRADIRRNVFRNNSSCYGGGLEMYHCESSGVSVIEENVFSGNRADVWGGGVFNVDSSPIIRRNTFVNNGGSSQAGVWVLGGSPRIEFNLIVGSRWAVYCQSQGGYPPSLPVIGNNLCWRIGSETLTDCMATSGLQVVNPLFCDADAGDFRVCSNSPAIEGEVVRYGALGVGCPDCGSTAARPTGWGGLKGLYGARKHE